MASGMWLHYFSDSCCSLQISLAPKLLFSSVSQPKNWAKQAGSCLLVAGSKQAASLAQQAGS